MSNEGEGLPEYFFDIEHDGVPDDVRNMALELAIGRGGQTCPVSDYDVRRAREIIAGEIKEIDLLRRDLAAAHALLGECETALSGVVAVADRKTVEFDAAKIVLTKLKARK